MLKSILVPLDGSPLAETALPYALQIVEDGGEITLLRVIDETPAIIEDSPLFLNTSDNIIEQQQKEDLLKHAKDYLARVVTHLDQTNLKIEMVALHGKPADEIIDIAKNSRIDVIVMSTHGRTGLSRWVIGSVTQKVITATKCPVFIVPNQQ